MRYRGRLALWGAIIALTLAPATGAPASDGKVYGVGDWRDLRLSLMMDGNILWVFAYRCEKTLMMSFGKRTAEGAASFEGTGEIDGEAGTFIITPQADLVLAEFRTETQHYSGTFGAQPEPGSCHTAAGGGAVEGAEAGNGGGAVEGTEAAAGGGPLPNF